MPCLCCPGSIDTFPAQTGHLHSSHHVGGRHLNKEYELDGNYNKSWNKEYELDGNYKSWNNEYELDGNYNKSWNTGLAKLLVRRS